MSIRPYRVHGLRLDSEIPLPHARSEPAAGAADVTVRLGKAPPIAVDFRLEDWLRGNARAVQFDAPGTGTFTCRDGREIVISPAPEASDNAIELYCLGTALGIVHYQRGDFPIHGAFLTHGERAFGICGYTGEGKSTLGYALASAGCTLLTDDVAIIRMRDRVPVVFAENTHLKLWREAAGAFGLQTDGFSRIDGREDKFYVPIPTASVQRAPALHAMIYLESAAPDAAFALEPVPLVAALALLREQTYRPFLIPLLKLNQRQLEFGANVAGRVRSFRFARPRDLARMDEGAAFLMRALEDALR